MHDDSSNPLFKDRDRILGDEWKGWHGNIDKPSRSGKRIFFGVLLAVVIAFGAIIFGIWYMISPRLEQFHPYLPLITGLLLGILWVLFMFWFLLMVLSVWTEKDYVLKCAGREFTLTFLVPFVLRFGARLGISRDRLGNSFLKVSNKLIKATSPRVKPEKLLILLPRCLQKSIISTISSFSEQWNIPIYTVSGGEKAREVVSKIKPKAIIGVACERDLLSGIQEIIGAIPVIGIPNIRPQGPCKDTLIDIKEFEKAVQTFLGPHVRLKSNKSITLNPT